MPSWLNERSSIYKLKPRRRGRKFPKKLTKKPFWLIKGRIKYRSMKICRMPLGLKLSTRISLSYKERCPKVTL
jgi:hypothetical protein